MKGFNLMGNIYFRLLFNGKRRIIRFIVGKRKILKCMEWEENSGEQ